MIEIVEEVYKSLLPNINETINDYEDNFKRVNDTNGDGLSDFPDLEVDNRKVENRKVEEFP